MTHRTRLSPGVITSRLFEDKREINLCYYYFSVLGAKVNFGLCKYLSENADFFFFSEQASDKKKLEP